MPKELKLLKEERYKHIHVGQKIQLECNKLKAQTATPKENLG
jgi:hypothetical protein